MVDLGAHSGRDETSFWVPMAAKQTLGAPRGSHITAVMPQDQADLNLSLAGIRQQTSQEVFSEVL